MIVETNAMRIALDPRHHVKADLVFISHAHSDHLPSYVGEAPVLATRETIELAKLRGLRIKRHIDEIKDLKLIDTGHILGSSGLLIEETIYYTGDIAGRRRGFMPEASRINCETLVIESTYGKPQYVFPPTEDLVREVKKSIATMFALGRPVAVVGYPLGKSQVLAYLLREWRPLVCFKSIEDYNRVYRSFGVEIPIPDRVLSRSGELLELGSRPAVILAPSSIKKRVSMIMSRLGGLTMWFSGWALYDSSPDILGVPISDHADHEELVRFAVATRAKSVYTTHGFSEDLANSLKALGVNARPLESAQQSIQDYI